MPAVPSLALAIGVALLSSIPGSQAQSPGNRVRTEIDSGIARNAHKFMWDTPEAAEGSRPDNAAKENGKPREAATPPPPPAEARENPRTMITRDRIESPQH